MQDDTNGGLYMRVAGRAPHIFFVYLAQSIKSISRRCSLEVRSRVIVLASILLGFNALLWLAIAGASYKYPLLLGLATLAYCFGLRHAADADHIAAIDNTTRKLMHQGERPVAIGFFFSLGHSTIVIALSIAAAVSASFVQAHLPSFKDMGALIGATVSCLFLLVIGIINLSALIEIVNAWRQVRRGAKHADHDALEKLLNHRGLLSRLLRPVLALASKSWHMYPIGILFGLGFDTATEVGLLSISAVTAASGMPLWGVILLPLAFTAGMALIDTLDGVLMLGAYGWAYVKPIRKLYYNMNITLISVVVALFIGGIEILQLLSTELNASSGIFAFANGIDFGITGYFIIALFMVSWIGSYLFYKFTECDLLDEQRTVTDDINGRLTQRTRS
jgi:high-affinity nickel-transport protein